LIPEEIAERTDLTPSHKLILGIIGRIQGASATCYPSMAYIAKSAGMSRRQTRRVVGDLVKRGEATRLFHQNKTSTYAAKWATGRNIRRAWAEKKATA
jgi:DNA-binding MarR family transcriptional regulator